MIVCLGEALVDLFASPRGRGVDDAEAFLPCVGGAPVNVAVALGRLGARARFVGAVGDDGHGRRVLAALESAGVDTRCVDRRRERTGVTFVKVAEDGARSFLFYRRDTADTALTAEALAGFALDPLDAASWLVLGSTALAAPPLSEVAASLVHRATARGVPVLLDLNCRRHLWRDAEALQRAMRSLCDAASVVKASEDDLADLGLPATLDALRALAPRAVPVLTLAERGCVADVGGVLSVEPARLAPEAVIDATGAGDAFVAGLLVGLGAEGALATRSRWERALALGNATGALAVTALGALEALRPPWSDAVREALASVERSGEGVTR